MKLNKELTKKFNKINFAFKLDKFFHKETYDFDNGQVIDEMDIIKNYMKCRVIKLNTDITNNKSYMVFTILFSNNKHITHQMLETFSTKTKANEYFKKLCQYLKNNSDEEIINRCYNDLTKIPRKKIFLKKLDV